MICIDMHCDAVAAAFRDERPLAAGYGGRPPFAGAQQGHVDLPRLRQAGINVQFFALFPERLYYPGNTLLQVLRLIDFANEAFTADPDVILIRSRRDLERCLNSGKLGALLTVEGGEALEGEIRMLRILQQLGVRGLGLTWNNRNDLADGVGESGTGGGLTRLGRQVIAELNRLGMVVDVSHLSEAGFWETLELSRAPVIASHSNSSYVWEHRRNLTDSQIRGIAQNQGVIGVNLVPGFVGQPGAGLEAVIDHIDHICELVGDDHAGFGCDFDGTDELVAGITDVTGWPALVEALRLRGYNEESVAKICGQNCLRVLRSVLRAD
jgi:membrane dipeptidase